jgi:hypothetical protein
MRRPERMEVWKVVMDISARRTPVKIGMKMYAEVVVSIDWDLVGVGRTHDLSLSIHKL